MVEVLSFVPPDSNAAKVVEKPESYVFPFGSVSFINQIAHFQFFIDGQQKVRKLSPIQSKMFRFLLENCGKAVPLKDLAKATYGDDQQSYHKTGSMACTLIITFEGFFFRGRLRIDHGVARGYTLIVVQNAQ